MAHHASHYLFGSCLKKIYRLHYTINYDNFIVPLFLPVWLDIVRTAKEFQLACAGGQALNDAIDLVRFMAGGTNLSYNYISIQTTVYLWIALHANLKTKQKKATFIDQHYLVDFKIKPQAENVELALRES